MNSCDWERLRKNWEQILDLYPSDLCSRLFSKNVLSSDDKRLIEQSGTTSEQMKTLMNVLKKKPPEKQAFNAFINAIESDENNIWLAKQIVATESRADPKLTAKVDPHLLDKSVKESLRQHYTDKDGAETPLSDVRKMLKHEGVFTDHNEWDNATLLEFICKEFTRVEKINRKKRVGRNRQTKIYLTNIVKVEQTDQEIVQSGSTDQPESVDPIGQATPLKNMKDMSQSELRTFFTPIFEKNGWDVGILRELEKKDITGQVFLAMTDDDFQKEIPTASYGVRKTFLEHSKDYSQRTEVKLPPENLRKFDTKVTSMVKYHQGRCVDMLFAHTKGKKTWPIKNFHLIENQDKALDFIGSEVIPFAAACLNERQNGTIYFGISPDNSSSFKAGEIVGVDLKPEDVQAEVNEFITKSFLETQRFIIESTVREAKFVPVIGTSTTNLHVIEVDIVPCLATLKTETIRTKLSWLPLHSKKRKGKDGVFGFSETGLPKVLNPEEMNHFENNKQTINQQRKQEEGTKKSNDQPNLRRRILNLLTGGEEIMQDQVYPFFLTSTIDHHSMDMPYLLANTQFVKQLQPEIVFDFDPTGSTNGIYKSLDSEQEVEMRVVTSDSFDKAQRKPEDYKALKEGLANENRITWMFCNGYSENLSDAMDACDWNKKRRSPFQEALQFYIDRFGQDRIIFIICLFSKEYSAMIEACDEVLTKLENNWLLLAETEEEVDQWRDEMFRRNRASKKDLSDRCIIGMQWADVNSTIVSVTKRIEEHRCILPCSTGALVEIREKKLKDWCDLNILTAGDFHFVNDELQQKRKREVGEKFYKGEQVDWLNFYFHNQVLKRDIHDELMKNVRDALNGNDKDDDDKITYLRLFHQPGAGGTTSAKQVLWDMRKEYRCCVVSTITDQTCDQLDEVRRFQDNKPKPLLILIDNQDEDRWNQLRGNLENKGRKRWKESDEHFDVYCTIIVCIRRPSLPKQLKQRQIALKQELTQIELDWFRDTNDRLMAQYNKNKDTNANPKFLISFNILRENFNKDYVLNVVKEFSDAVQIEMEVKLLKIVSLLNTYDPNFKKIPVACLDKILEVSPCRRKQQSSEPVKRDKKWETNLSQGVKVLLNISSTTNQHGKSKQCLRVFNKVIAIEILARMKERTQQKESEIMLELIECVGFGQDNDERKDLQDIINNVFKQRETKDNKKERYSNFVTYIKCNEGFEIAENLVIALFQHNQDPFTAQLIARLYMELKNWSLAEKYARIATSMYPTNSFLWDTYSQVFKHQLQDKIVTENSLDKGGFDESEIHEVISLSKKCIQRFRKEQKASENESSTDGENNFAGYFGELRAIILLLSGLKQYPAFRKVDILHRYLIEEHFKHPAFDFLTDEESDFIKSLGKFSQEAMRRLNEEYLQMKETASSASSTQSFENGNRSLLILKVNIDSYFGEATKNPSRSLSEKDKSIYRYHTARYLGATSLNNLLQMKQNGEHEKLKQIYRLLHENVSMDNSSFDNLLALMDTVTVMLLDQVIQVDLKYEQILEWCKQLRSLVKTKSVDRIYLEPYLYYVLFNFPTEERSSHKLCLPLDLSSTLDLWHDAFQKKYPIHGQEQTVTRKVTTPFFLGNGGPLHDVVHYTSLEMMKNSTLFEKWQLPEVRDKLKLFSGILLEGGDIVKLPLNRNGNIFHVNIATSHRVKQKPMWLKKVYFYVGFSFQGPRAYGMSTEDPGVAIQTIPRSLANANAVCRVPRPFNGPKLADLIAEQKDFEKHLERHKGTSRQTELKRKLQEINKKIKSILGSSE